MGSNTLRVRASGQALVHCIEAMHVSPRRYIGREWVEVDGKWGLAPVAGPVDIPDRAEYRMAIRDGDLEPADQATAAACGVPFAQPVKNALKYPGAVDGEKD